ncbi:Axoneme associated protein [Entamoeba marina]
MDTNWVSSLYKAEQKLSLLNSKHIEISDAQRHLHDLLDHAQLDYDASFAGSKNEIADKISDLKSKIAMLETRKTPLVKAMKHFLNKYPKEYREQMIRNTHLERYFKPIDAVLESIPTQTLA